MGAASKFLNIHHFHEHEHRRNDQWAAMLSCVSHANIFGLILS